MLKLHREQESESRPIRVCVVQSAGGVPLIDLQALTQDPRLHVTCQEDWHALVAGETSGVQASAQQQWEESPELILVAQGWSEAQSGAEIQRLQDRYPLARMVCVYGPLCESDGRTRQTWPGALRVPKRKLGWRLEQEIRVLRGESAPLPWTATREEIVRHELRALAEQEGKQQVSENPKLPEVCVIHSPDRAWSETVVDLLPAERVAGLQQTARMHELYRLLLTPHEPWLLLLDIDPTPEYMISWLNQHAERFAADHVILVTNQLDAESHLQSTARFPCQIVERLAVPELCQQLS